MGLSGDGPSSLCFDRGNTIYCPHQSRYDSPYPHHRNLPRSEQATIARQHQIDMNYWNSWLNIVRAVFVCLDTCIDDAFKISNQSGQTGWNATMSIAEMFAQLMNTYGQPSPVMIFENDSIFRQRAAKTIAKPTNNNSSRHSKEKNHATDILHSLSNFQEQTFCRCVVDGDRYPVRDGGRKLLLSTLHQ